MVQTTTGKDNGRVREKKRGILEAASRVFRRRGLQAAGMREIAAETGMHAGNLYYYFENKQDLLAFCQREALRSLGELARRVGALEAPADVKLARLIEGHVVCLNEDIPGSLAHLEVEALDEAWRGRILERRAEYEGFLRELLREGAAAGVLRPLDEKIASRAILGALNWTVKWFRPDGERSAGSIGRELAELLIGGLRAVPGPRPESTLDTAAAARR